MTTPSIQTDLPLTSGFGRRLPFDFVHTSMPPDSSTQAPDLMNLNLTPTKQCKAGYQVSGAPHTAAPSVMVDLYQLATPLASQTIVISN
jgi:hypothetical protein